MALLDLAFVKQQLRVFHDSEDVLLGVHLGSAERYAQRFLGRNVYATAEEAAAARAAAPAAVAAAAAAYETARTATQLLDYGDERTLQEEDDLAVYRDALNAAQMQRRAIELNDNIRMGIVQIVGNLWVNRGDVPEEAVIPPAARALLWQDRERPIL